MRAKFFVTIFCILSLTAISISAIHFHFFKQERLRLIELNLQQNASLLKNSDLTLTKSEFSELGHEFIESIIGDDKVNMVIAIYNFKGNVLYKNDNAEIFEMPNFLSSKTPQWEDIETKEYFIKYLTLRDEEQKRIIKVGMILNQSLLRWKDLNQRIFLFGAIILLVITIISLILTVILLRPVNLLAEQVNHMSEKIEKGEFNDFKSWFSLLKNKRKGHDEFQRLVSSLDKLANKIIENQNQSKKWSALMAHELKTPMTILKNNIETLTRDFSIPFEKVQNVENELNRLEEIIMNFLEWASLENDTARPEIHVVIVNKRSFSLLSSINSVFPDAKINFKDLSTTERRIFCHPLHFDQVVSNLLINAIKYGSKEIEFLITDHTFSIKDQGPGIPKTVIDNFGRPFNKFKYERSNEGFGLGLAWVNTIAKKYDWNIRIDNSIGSLIEVDYSKSLFQSDSDISN